MSTYRSGDLHATNDEVERYNRRESWNDVASNLRVAHESLERAMGALEDIGLSAIGVRSMYDQLRSIEPRVVRMRENAEHTR